MDLKQINEEIQDIKIKIKTHENLIRAKQKVIKGFKINSIQEAEYVLKEIKGRLKLLEKNEAIYKKKAEDFLELIR
jgi:myo-inositol-hexaphosphate 3-phosphohydrolase